MSKECCEHQAPQQPDPRYRNVLLIALLVNAGMFAVEVISGIESGSVSLLADAVDFLGDAANYAISLWVLGMSLAMRARASLIKAASMGLFGIGVLGNAAWNAMAGTLPDAQTMGVVGLLALAANVGVAVMLYAWRNGDSNMRSVWLCTRNDAIGNIVVMIAALGVFGTGTAWPDLVVATLMAGLALSTAWQVFRQAMQEIRHT